MSNSWGIVPTSVWSPIVVGRLGQLAKTGGRRGKGILFLFAAGNENCPIQHEAAVDVPYTDGWGTSGASAIWVGVETTRHFENNLVNIPGVLHVAALSSLAQRSHYSNYGTGIALCAPTSNSHEYHRATVKGLGITTTTGPGSGVTASFGGTSSATPLTAGIAALVISANPELTALQVASILKRTASKDLRMTGYGRTPPATFDVDTSWDVSPIAPFDDGAFTDSGSADGTWSPWFGHGRVDAAAAVTEALGATVAPVADTRFEANVAKPIPDNKPVGVRSVIAVASTDRVQKVKVTVDISHSWIGDLRITLTGPSGTKVLLHDRSGAGKHDIKQTYEPATLPALASFKDQDVQGDWVLEVQDLAERDIGTLHTWALDFELAAGPLLVRDETTMMIPDNDPAGIVRVLDVPAGHIIQDVAVSVDITHPYTGDLLVTLTPPSSGSIALHSRAGWDADNLRRTWRTGDLPGLQALRGHDAAGKWTLKVADLAGRDVGKLNRWSVEISS
jgi:subtilisin-like proprotein convertase family protein